MLLAICEKKLAIFASTGNYFRPWLVYSSLYWYCFRIYSHRLTSIADFNSWWNTPFYRELLSIYYTWTVWASIKPWGKEMNVVYRWIDPQKTCLHELPQREGGHPGCFFPGNDTSLDHCNKWSKNFYERPHRRGRTPKENIASSPMEIRALAALRSVHPFVL